MDKQLMDAGREVRREVRGDEYVDRAMKNADDFNKPFQIAVYCGIPVGVDCFRTAKQVIAEMK